MSRSILGSFAAATIFGVLLATPIPANASRQPQLVAPSPTVAVAGNGYLNFEVPPTSNPFAGVVGVTPAKIVLDSPPTAGTITNSGTHFQYIPPRIVAFDKEVTTTLQYHLQLTIPDPKGPTKATKHKPSMPRPPVPENSAVATVTIHVSPVTPLPPTLVVLASGATSTLSPTVIVGGFSNPSEFLVPLSGYFVDSAYNDTFTLTVTSLSCNIAPRTQTVMLANGASEDFTFSATAGEWRVTLVGTHSGSKSSQFTIGGRPCANPAPLPSITFTGGESSTAPSFVAPYEGRANGLTPNTTKNLFVKTATGFPATVKEDKNPAYDAAQAESQTTGCHAVGTGANVRFIGCDEIAPVPGNSSSSSAFTSTPAIVVYVIIGFALLASAFARRARGKSA